MSDAAEVFKHAIWPGAVLLTSGIKGSGKSHTAIAVAEMLVKRRFPGMGRVEVLTNMMFFHRKGGQIVEETPPGVHHITTMKELFIETIRILDTRKEEEDLTILVIMDEAQNFLRGETNNVNASLMMKDLLGIIRKFRMAVWFLTPTATGIGPAFRCWINDPKEPGNVTTKLFKSPQLNQAYIEANGLEGRITSKELMAVKSMDTPLQLLRIPVTEWTQTRHTLKEGEYCYDHEASATFWMGDDFDWDTFNRTIGGVSSMRILDTMRDFFAKSGTKVEEESEAKRMRDEIDRQVAVKLCEFGDSTTDAATKTGLSRDAVQYTLKKRGYTYDSKGKKWVRKPESATNAQHSDERVASSLRECGNGGSKIAPIYISKENPGNRVRETSGELSPEPKDGIGIVTPVPDGRYTLGEMKRAVKWCIGEGEE